MDVAHIIRPAYNPDRRRRPTLHRRQHGIVRGKPAQFSAHTPDAFLQSLVKRRVKQLPEIGRHYTRFIRRFHRTEAQRPSSRQKIPDFLHRRKIGAAPERKRLFLQLFLKFNSCQRMHRAEISLVHVDQHRRVGIFLIARKLAHAVGNHVPLKAGCRHHRPARTHAERINRPSAVQMFCQFVIRRPEIPRATVFLSVLRQIDVRLFMLYAHPYCKRLLCHLKPAPVQHAERIARRMPDRQDQRIRRKLIARPVRPFNHRRTQNGARTDGGARRALINCAARRTVTSVALCPGAVPVFHAASTVLIACAVPGTVIINP